MPTPNIVALLLKARYPNGYEIIQNQVKSIPYPLNPVNTPTLRQLQAKKY